MARPPKPWYRASRGEWCVTLGGKHIRLGKDHADATREFHRLLSLEAPIEPGKLTVEVLIDRYLVESRPKLAAVTYVGKRFALQRFIDHFGRLKASELRPFHVTRWLADHPEWNQATKRTMTAIVKTWSSWATREGYLDVDRLRSIRMAGGPPRKPAPPGDLEKLLAGIEDPAFHDFIVVLMDTGCRPGEIRSLEATRIDFKASVAVVRGKRGLRTIGLSRRASRVLNHHARNWPKGPVLRNGYGMPWTISTLKRRFDAACEKAGIPHAVPYHARHDYYRRAHAAGVDSVMIARQLGHVDLKMLASVYAHPDAAQLAAAAEAVVSPPSKPARDRKKSRRAARRPKR